MRTTVKTPHHAAAFTLALAAPASARVVQADAELVWLFEEAESAIAPPSHWETLVDHALGAERRKGDVAYEGAEKRADALHKARGIVERIEALPAPLADALVAAYRPAPWPARYELALGRLAGVVASLACVRSDHALARQRGTTAAESPAAWLEEQLTGGDDARVRAAREEAGRLHARAVAAYRMARRSTPSLASSRRGGER